MSYPSSSQAKERTLNSSGQSREPCPLPFSSRGRRRDSSPFSRAREDERALPLLCLLLEMERTPLPVSLVRKRERLKPCPLRSSSSRQSSRLSSLPFSSRGRKRLFTSFRERGRWLYPRLSSPAEGESTLPLPSCSQERRVQPCPLRSCSRESREKRERLSFGFF